MKTNVIVTGGAGFIGSCLCKVLAQRNFNPVTVDNLSTGYRQLVKFGDFVEADFGDYEKMVEVFKKFKPLAIFHIAGSKSVEESMRNPHKYFLNNVSKTNELLKATVDCGIENFIFSSTAAIFGMPKNSESGVKEDDAKLPINPYGFSKLMCENLLDGYAISKNLKSTSLRYFNVTGSDPDLEVGEITKNPANIFPIISEVIDQKRSEFVIFGSDYSTKDGTCIRDYIHVIDLVNGHIMALETQLKKNESAKINLGNGNGFSVMDVVNTFKEVASTNFKVASGARRIGDPDVIIANNELAKNYLNWEPKHTSLKDQVYHSWQWHKKSKNFL